MRNIESGQGFEWYDHKGVRRYGVILNTSVSNVEAVLVVPCIRDNYTLVSYDDANAKESRDKHHVRLNSCPPPFSDLGTYYDLRRGKMSNAMAIANLDNTISFSNEFFNQRCRILDDGVTISDKDMYRIWNHPFPRQPEKELVYADRRKMFDFLIDETERDFDMDMEF